MRLIIGGLFLCLFSSSLAEQFKMEDKVIRAKISYQNLNRISVRGDKIDSILGIDSAFHVEKNDKTGEAFIRPTEDNGYAPISLSITTMSGRTQDLLLEVVDGEANSIELMSNTSATSQDLSPLFDAMGTEENNSSNDYEEIISSVMKKFINLPPNRQGLEITGVTDRLYDHLKATFESGYRLDGFLCLRFKVTTDKQGVFRLDERMFSKEGDVALSLSDLALGKNSKATLYVLRKS